MATHSSVLAWRIPGMEEPGRLPSTGSHRVRHDCSDFAAAALQETKMFPIDQLQMFQFSSAVSNSLRPHEPPHARSPWPSPTPKAYSNWCPLSRWCHPTISSPSPPIFPRIRVFSNESVLCIMWPKYWNFSFNISSSNEYSGLIYFRMIWLDLLDVQGTVKSSPTPQLSKTSILLHSAFFIVQLWHPYMTAGKTIALTRRTFVGKVMSLLFNMLSQLGMTFRLRCKHPLTSNV